MSTYPVPANEAERNEALRTYEIMDSAAEIAFDEVGELAAQICGCEISYIAFCEDDRFWFKAKYGLPPDFTSCPREISFCQYTLCGSELVHVPDLTRDDRYRENPFVVNDPHLKFYCAMPLINPQGYALGTICVMDFEPRELSFEHQEALRRLGRQVVGQLELRRKVIELDRTTRDLDAARRAVEGEKARAEELLKNILPESIADELKANGRVEPRHFPAATILFTDFRNFTALAETAEPAMLVALLHEYFSAFDEVVARHGLEKIKTIGDAYMAVAGVPTPSRRHAADACLAALQLLDAVLRLKAQREKARLPALDVRIGLHSGSVMAGVVGKRKFTYDIWGDAVNVAARIEQADEANRINMSDQVYGQVKSFVEATPRGTVEVKNRAPVPMYFLDRLKPEFSKDADGRLPNERFLAECDGATGAGGGWGRSGRPGTVPAG